MRGKSSICIALVLSAGCAVSLERTALADPAQSLFGFSWPPQQQYRSQYYGAQYYGAQYYGAQSAVYPAYARTAKRRIHAKRHYAMHKAKPHSEAAVKHIQLPELAERLATAQKLSPGTLSVFLSDPTLRRNDAVMTNAGIFIFRGGSLFKGYSADHAPGDFVSLSNTKPIAHRAELAEIQKVSLQHFEVAELEMPKPDKSFADISQSGKTFEVVEMKAVRHIAGIEAF